MILENENAKMQNLQPQKWSCNFRLYLQTRQTSANLNEINNYCWVILMLFRFTLIKIPSERNFWVLFISIHAYVEHFQPK